MAGVMQIHKIARKFRSGSTQKYEKIRNVALCYIAVLSDFMTGLSAVSKTLSCFDISYNSNLFWGHMVEGSMESFMHREYRS